MEIEYLIVYTGERFVNDILKERGHKTNWTLFSLEVNEIYRTFKTNKEIDNETIEEIKRRNICIYKRL